MRVTGLLRRFQRGQYRLRQRQRHSAGAHLTVEADRALAKLRQRGNMLFHLADITARHWAGHAAGDTGRGNGSRRALRHRQKNFERILLSRAP